MFTTICTPLEKYTLRPSLRLHAQEGQAWLSALLQTPKLHDVIADIDMIHSMKVCSLLLRKHQTVALCLHRAIKFQRRARLETLLLAEEVWRNSTNTLPCTK